MKTAILSLFGDGLGNLSMMRVVMLLVVLALIATKFWNAAYPNNKIEWTGQDLAILGSVVGGKLIQNTQEK